jgi:hypothetical protein
MLRRGRTRGAVLDVLPSAFFGRFPEMREDAAAYPLPGSRVGAVTLGPLVSYRDHHGRGCPGCLSSTSPHSSRGAPMTRSLIPWGWRTTGCDHPHSAARGNQRSTLVLDGGPARPARRVTVDDRRAHVADRPPTMAWRRLLDRCRCRRNPPTDAKDPHGPNTSVRHRDPARLH